MQKLLLVYYYSENHATSQIWKVLPNMVFPLILGENGGVLGMHMQVILDSLFACLGSASVGGKKKGDIRNWTRLTYVYVWEWGELPYEQGYFDFS